VGIHLHAESHDRPLAYKLHHHLIAWQDAICDEVTIEPAIMTDIWYLNHAAMCTGTAILFKIPRVVIGENTTFTGAEHWLCQAGIEVTVLNDQRCIEMMRRFIGDYPDLWNEDIGIPDNNT